MENKGKTTQQAAEDLHLALKYFGVKLSEIIIIPIIEKTSNIIEKWKIIKESMK